MLSDDDLKRVRQVAREECLMILAENSTNAFKQRTARELWEVVHKMSKPPAVCEECGGKNGEHRDIPHRELGWPGPFARPCSKRSGAKTSDRIEREGK